MDRLPADPSRGHYYYMDYAYAEEPQGPLIEQWITVGALTVLGNPEAQYPRVSVSDSSAAFGQDRIDLLFEDWGYEGRLTLIDNSGQAVSSDAIPTTWNLEDWPDLRRLSLHSSAPGTYISGIITGVTVVPEPSTILAGVLMMLPFGIKGIRQHRRQQPAASRP